MPYVLNHPVLAQSKDMTQVWIWVAVLLVVVVVGGVLIVFIRKNTRDSGAASPALGLSLADLREMRADGRLSEEEFERAKAMVIGQLGGKVDQPGMERIRVDGRVVDGELRARAGFDLTGQPLPDFGGPDNATDGDSGSPPDEAGGDGLPPER